MDLVHLSKKAVQNPFHISNFFVLFTTVFLLLIVGLSLISVLGRLSSQIRSNTACDSTQNKKISGNALNTGDTVYHLNYAGNSSCFLSISLTWEKEQEAVALWVYNPNGKIDIVKPENNQTYTQFYKSSPLPAGEWRFVIKAEKGTQVNYSGNLSVQ